MKKYLCMNCRIESDTEYCGKCGKTLDTTPDRLKPAKFYEKLRRQQAREMLKAEQEKQ